MNHLLSISLLSATTLVSAASSQDADQPAKQDPAMTDSKHVVWLETLMATPVRLVPTEGARAEARADGEDAERPEVTIVEILATPEYKFEHAVLSVGGILGVGSKHVLVPWGDLVWAKRDEAFAMALPRTIKQLEAAKAFDLEAACEHGLERAVRDYCDDESDERGTVEASDARDDTDKGKDTDEEVFVTPSIVRVSQLSGVSFCDKTRDTRGTVERWIVRPADHSLEFCVLACEEMEDGQTARLVPVKSLRPWTKNETLMVHVPLTKAQLSELLVYTASEDSEHPILDGQAKKAQKCFDDVAGKHDVDG